MALYPEAVPRLLAENNTQPGIVPRLAILHTALDGRTTSSLYGWWNQTNLESHFYVQGDKDGAGVEQYMSTSIRADANVKANYFAVSIETWDGRAPDGPANRWGPLQAAAIVRLLVWICRTHGIPARLADRFDGTGIGFHNQFAEWSVGGTSCPGAPRRDQLINEIIPAVAAQLNGTPAPAPTPTLENSMDKFTNPDGRGEFAALMPDGKVNVSWQSSPTSTYSNWAPPAPQDFKATGVFAEVVGDTPWITAVSAPYGVLMGTCRPPGKGWTPWFNVNDFIAYMNR